MANDEKTTKKTPLSTMLGGGDFIEIQGKQYKIKPLKLKDVDNFIEKNVSLGSQIFNLADEKSKKDMNEWLSKYCYDENDSPVNFETAIEQDWDIVDLKTFIKKLCDISG